MLRIDRRASQVGRDATCFHLPLNVLPANLPCGQLGGVGPVLCLGPYRLLIGCSPQAGDKPSPHSV
ncbi:MAG: hypothetical protein RML45_12440 [Acetobacteraceae bacterium]|nr:hypothetical protein [Acetobacteraceae bacterium]